MSAGARLVALFVDTVGKFTNTGFFTEGFYTYACPCSLLSSENKVHQGWHNGLEIG